MKKEIGYIGLGKMGKNMVFRLLSKGWKVVVCDHGKEKMQEVENKGGRSAENFKDLASKLSAPRIIWIMVPHQGVESVIDELLPHLQPGDLIIDGGNSPYHESMNRYSELQKKGIEFLDIGVSGGPDGALNGACMMAGGKKQIYEALKDAGFFEDTCIPEGFEYMGKAGSGHFVKMIHNGIEYGMMQSIAEGFDLLRHSKEFDLDISKIAEVYSHGSVITSRLVSWMRDGYKKYGKDLNQISGKASSLGEGHWTLQTAKKENVPMPALEAAIATREKSQAKPSYQGKAISTMRGEFGKHPVKRGEDEPEIL